LETQSQKKYKIELPKIIAIPIEFPVDDSGGVNI
jgi:hypothetical protein